MSTPVQYIRVLIIAGALGLSSCSFAPKVSVPETVEKMPDAYSYASESSTSDYQPVNWWHTFEDPVLNRLIDTTLTSNLDLVEAVARVAEVRAQYRIERSGLFPSLEIAANGSHTDQPANSGFGAQFAALTGGGEGGEGSGEGGGNPVASAPSRTSFESYTANATLSYELDLWGRVRNSSKAALREYFASEADLEAARLAVIGQAIQTYFEVVDLRRRIAFNLETVDVLTERVSRTQERYDRGLVTSFELYNTLQDYRNTQSNLPLLEKQLANAEGRLAVIAGTYAGQLDALFTDTLAPQLVMSDVPASLPADLLNQRPDVRASAQRMEAARYRIGARKAERYPTIRPSGTLGLQSSVFKDLFDLNQWYLNLAAGITAPVFQGGRINANIDAAEARYIQLAAAYTRTVLTAFQEVESALAGLEEDRQRYLFLAGQLEEAQAAVTLQADRYESGVGEYLSYLDALRTVYNVETNLSTAAREMALSRLTVHRALGGGWTEETPNPDLKMTAGPVEGTR